ncbi:MAG: helix-turn-helix domain-containing protein [Pseudomonadota bacterium]
MDLDFAKAVEILELDPARDFRNSDLTGIDLSGCTPEEYDFTGAVIDGEMEDFFNFRSLVFLDPKGELSQITSPNDLNGLQPNNAAVSLISSELNHLRRRAITISQIKEAASQYYSIKISDLDGLNRNRAFFRPRYIVMYLACELTKHSLSTIARRLGGRDHTTVIHGRNRIKDEILQDTTLRDEISDILYELDKIALGFEHSQAQSIFMEKIDSYSRSLQRRDLDVRTIRRSVAKEFNIRIADIAGPKRLRSYSLPRQIVMYLSGQLTSRTPREIGLYLGGRAESTVRNGKANIERLMSQDLEIQESIVRVLRELVKQTE